VIPTWSRLAPESRLILPDTPPRKIRSRSSPRNCVSRNCRLPTVDFSEGPALRFRNSRLSNSSEALRRAVRGYAARPLGACTRGAAHLLALGRRSTVYRAALEAALAHRALERGEALLRRVAAVSDDAPATRRSARVEGAGARVDRRAAAVLAGALAPRARRQTGAASACRLGCVHQGGSRFARRRLVEQRTQVLELLLEPHAHLLGSAAHRSAMCGVQRSARHVARARGP